MSRLYRVDALFVSVWAVAYATTRTVFADDETLGHAGARGVLLVVSAAYVFWALQVWWAKQDSQTDDAD